MWEYCFPLCAAEAPPQLFQGKAPKGPNCTGAAFQKTSGDSQHEGDVQEISSREMCRTFPSRGRCAGLLHLMRHRESENVLGGSLQQIKAQAQSGASENTTSNKIPQLLLELPGGSLGAEAAAEPLCQELPLLPQPSLGTRAPQTFTTTSSHCSVSSAKLQPLKGKPGMQRWHFLLQWENSKTWRHQQPSWVHCLLSTCHAVGHAH